MIIKKNNKFYFVYFILSYDERDFSMFSKSLNSIVDEVMFENSIFFHIWINNIFEKND